MNVKFTKAKNRNFFGLRNLWKQGTTYLFPEVKIPVNFQQGKESNELL